MRFLSLVALLVAASQATSLKTCNCQGEIAQLTETISALAARVAILEGGSGSDSLRASHSGALQVGNSQTGNRQTGISEGGSQGRSTLKSVVNAVVDVARHEAGTSAGSASGSQTRSKSSTGSNTGSNTTTKSKEINRQTVGTRRTHVKLI